MTNRMKSRFVIAPIMVILASLFCLAANAESITIFPREIKAGTSPTLTITSSPSFINLAQLNASQLEVNPATDVTDIRIVSAAADRLTLSFDLARTAVGNRTLNIKLSDDVVVTIKLALERDPLICSPACVAPRICENGRCQLPR
ncbi:MULTISPECIES: hypothetical protein [unclassified Bradyrhizobium]|uniref:hypothetical protein n=1 Tax=Bradyrhizobium sp. USDA 4541 TaxID=2817704 RepID=UPI0020A351B6|nr:hypothetical protein [Bradyrhizobium sp. USDA 4541]MCP1850270.1 hypothetical protein [Bradyrhizobium sp. USDA 4541]